MMRVAVIGAGLAGLTAARDLMAAGHAVVVWEKSRGCGGRTATRRGPDGLRFDHGAPILQDGDAPLTGLSGLAEAALSYSDGASAAVVVGVGSNNGPAKRLADSVDVRASTRVTQLSPTATGWALVGEDGTELGDADAVVVTAPAPQTAELVQGVSPAMAERAAGVPFDPCWSVMAAWDEPLGLPFTAARATPGLAWAVAEAPKPNREAGERWVLQAPADWSRAHLEDEPGVVGAELLARFAALAGHPLPEPAYLAVHRWRYSRPAAPLRALFLRDGMLLAAGDWCGGDTAGAAVRSGHAAAAALIG